VATVLPFPLRKSSEPLQPLDEFLAEIRAMSSGSYKPADGGVLGHKWNSRAHHAYAGKGSPPSRCGREDR
jgi:hypothetical protein